MAKRYRFAFKRLDVYQAAVEHFEWTCAVVQRMPRGPFKVIDQAVSAATGEDRTSTTREAP